MLLTYVNPAMNVWKSGALAGKVVISGDSTQHLAMLPVCFALSA